MRLPLAPNRYCPYCGLSSVLTDAEEASCYLCSRPINPAPVPALPLLTRREVRADERRLA